MTKEKNKRKAYATQEAQNAASKRYYHSSEEVRQRRLYTAGRSQAKSFINKRATKPDLIMLSEEIEKNLKKFE